MRSFALDTREIDRIIECAYHPIVTSAWKGVESMSRPVCGATADIPLRKAVFYVVESRIDEDARVVPGPRFNSNCFMDQATLREVFVGNGNR